jgi:hypothetical protein
MDALHPLVTQNGCSHISSSTLPPFSILFILIRLLLFYHFLLSPLVQLPGQLFLTSLAFLVCLNRRRRRLLQ